MILYVFMIKRKCYEELNLLKIVKKLIIIDHNLLLFHYGNLRNNIIKLIII